jgi:hypothetical protein
MSRAPLSRLLAICCALAAFAAAGIAEGALVKVNDIVLRANGGFQPQTLPRHRFAPIEFEGFFEVSGRGGRPPVKLSEVVIDFDRDGRLSTAGLPSCSPSFLAAAGTREGREACGGAIVGTGRVEAFVALAGGGAVQGSAPLTIFNGPRQEGNPTVVLHARMTFPETQTFAILVPIERRPGGFRYRARLTVPEIAGGRGALTRVEVEIGRRFQGGGKRRSYVSARCSDGILHTHGRFTFAEGTIVDGSVERGCTAR